MPGVTSGVSSWNDGESRLSDPYSQKQGMSPLYDMRGSQYSNGYNSDQHSETNDDGPAFLLEHLATFSVGPQFGLVSPKDGLRRLLQMEKSNGIWTQKMQMRLEKKWVVIIDYENGQDVVERFPMGLIGDPTSYTSNDPRELYNNILVFVVREDPKNKSHAPAEMHIFQCLRVSAQEVVDEMKLYVSGKRKSGYRESIGPQGPLPPEPLPSNGGPSVKDQVNMFNAASAGPMPPNAQGHRIERPSAFARETSNDETSSTNSDKYERDVAILNHCFDDIERFIARLQHAAAAYKELERRRKTRKSKKKDMGDGMLSMRAKPPPEREFVDILQKFKLSFNLLAKLKSHIHDPNAPELVHFLFTPLALIVDAARDSNYGPNLASKVAAPLLTRDAVELLSNCCTSKENDLWLSLGDPWTVPREQWKGYNTAYHPVFSDGWAPEYPFLEERERAEHTATAAASAAQKVRREEIRRAQDEAEMREHEYRLQQHGGRYAAGGGSDYYYGSESPEQHYDMERMPNRDYAERASEFSNDSIEHMDPDRHQQQWLDDLKARGSKVVQVMYPRTANNDKELTVVRGEYLEVLDDTRKWWKARNIRGQVAHVPHTIVSPFATEEDIFNNPLYAARSGPSRGEPYYAPPSESARGEGASPEGHRPAPASADWVRRERQGKKDSLKPSRSSEPTPGEERTVIPPPPPPLPTYPKTESLRSVLKKPAAKEEPVDQARDLLHEELKERVTMHPRIRKKWAPIHHGSYLTAESTNAEVQQWLVEKDFGSRTQQVCRDLNGRMMFALTRPQLEKFLGATEGARLHSHLTVQKNVSGFKSSREHELASILEARRSRVEEDVSSADRILQNSPPPPSPPSPVPSYPDSDDDPEVASKTLRILLKEQRKKIMKN